MFDPQTDEAADLGHQVTLGEAQLKAVAEERDNLKHDLENTHLAKDELVKKVRGGEGRGNQGRWREVQGRAEMWRRR